MLKEVSPGTFETKQKGYTVWKDPVVAIAIISKEKDDGKTLVTKPIVGSARDDPAEAAETQLQLDDAEVRDIESAPDGTHQLSAIVDESAGTVEPIGIQYPGASHPDWEKVIERKRGGSGSSETK